MRENLPLKSAASNETIPKKLLVELAALSNLKFRIEIKSKHQSLVLPLLFKKDSNQVDVENLNLVTFSENKPEPASLTDENKTANSISPLDNDYITLRCRIISENVALVPPICILTPYTYPETNPIVDCIQLDEFDDDMLPEYSNLIKIPF